MVILGDHATTDRIPHTSESVDTHEYGMSPRDRTRCLLTLAAIFALPIVMKDCGKVVDASLAAIVSSAEAQPIEKPEQQQYLLYTEQRYTASK